MIADLAAILPLTEGVLWAAFLVLLRIGAMLAFVPAFGEQSVPMRVRLGLGLAFTLIVLPGVAADLPAPGPLVATVGMAGAELATGLFMGLILRLFVLALQIAGTIAAQSTSLSQIFGGSAGIDPMPAIGNILVIAGLALAVLLGLHVRLAAFMIDSYALVPAGQMIGPAVVSELGLAEIARAFSLAFSLSAPFVVASLIYNVTLGVINRAMPQLMVAFVGAPAITAGGLALLLIAAPVLLSLWVKALNAFLATPFATLP